MTQRLLVAVVFKRAGGASALLGGFRDPSKERGNG